jgi:hypothetical protein
MTEPGILSFARCQQQTQRYDYRCEFHSALDAT